MGSTPSKKSGSRISSSSSSYSGSSRLISSALPSGSSIPPRPGETPFSSILGPSSTGKKSLSKRPPKPFKLIMLGPGSSGKSTFMRNLRIMNDVMTDETGSVKKVTQKWLTNHRDIVIKHTWNMLKVIILNLTLPVGSASDMVRDSLNKVIDPLSKPESTTKNFRDMLSLMEHPSFPAALELAQKDPRNQSLLVNAEHFIDRAPVILDEDFTVPSAADVMYSSNQTTGVIQSNLKIDTNHGSFKVFLSDVGGQRNERRKWIHLFDLVDMVLFFMDVSDYVNPKPLWEDHTTDRWTESLSLLKQILNQSVFEKSLFRIILTKCDWVFDHYAASEKIEVNRLSVDKPEDDEDFRDDVPDSELSPEKRKQRERAKAAREKKAESAMSEPTLKMTTQEIMAYLRKQLPKYRDAPELNGAVTVETVENASERLDILYQLYLIHWPLEGEYDDPIPALIEREGERRADMIQRTLDSWGESCEDWVRYDTSYLRRQIVQYVWDEIQYSEDSRDTRFHSLQQPWDLLPKMVVDIERHKLNQISII